MKNKRLPSITNNLQSDHLHSEIKMQQPDQKKLKPNKKSKSLTPAIISLFISLITCIIPIIWIVYICTRPDEKILTGFESSGSDIKDLQRYGLSPDFSRRSDKFGYHNNPFKVPEYRNHPTLRLSRTGSNWPRINFHKVSTHSFVSEILFNSNFVQNVFKLS